MLLLNARKTVAISTLIAEVWGNDPPATAKNLISIYVLRLRRLIGDSDGKVLAYHSPGYQLRVREGEIDAHYFEDLVSQAGELLRQADPATAVGLLTEALSLWRGSALADLPESPSIKAETERLERLRLTAIELHAEATAALKTIDRRA